MSKRPRNVMVDLKNNVLPTGVKSEPEVSNDGCVYFGGGWGARYVDTDGRPVRRTPQTHPYNYDSFVLWRIKGESDGGVYSDRLYQWDAKKHDRLCQKHFGNQGQYWDSRAPELIEAFLRDYNEDPALKLIMIVQCCNQASGYPCWCFCYKSGKR